jgi:hypothetical protein
MIRDCALDLVVVNGENAAGGFGITEAIYQEFVDAGADAVTLGNHAWDQREALVFIERAPRLVRPANFPKGTPGRGAALVDTKNGQRALVVNAIGRVFMTPFDDPFAVIGRELDACPLRERRIPSWSFRNGRRQAGHRVFCDGRSTRSNTPTCRPPIPDPPATAPPVGSMTRSSACRRKSRCGVPTRYSVGPLRTGGRRRRR